MPWPKGIPRSPETRQKISEANKGVNHGLYGKHHSKETVQRIKCSRLGQSAWNKGLKTGVKPSNAWLKEHAPWNKGLRGVYSVDVLEKMSAAKLGKSTWSKGRKLGLAWNSGKPGCFTDATLQKMSRSQQGKVPWNKGKRYRMSPEGRAKVAAARRTPEARQIIREARIREILDGQFHIKMRPTRLELRVGELLQKLFPGEWLYVGDGKMHVGFRIPDFVHVRRKAVIEAFGSYWHKPGSEAARAALFEKYGYRVLVIWDWEFEHPRSLLKKVRKWCAVYSRKAE